MTTHEDDWTEIKADTTTTTSATEPAAQAEKPAKKKRGAKAMEPEPAIEPTPAKRGRKAKGTETAPVTATEPAPVAATPAPKKVKRTKSTATLADVFKGYVESLEADGKSDGTIASYRMELALAADDLGLETPIAKITPERVLLFMTSDRVMKKLNGKSKSPLSIDKTRRVLRQALTYAETAKLVATAPVPELAASH